LVPCRYTAKIVISGEVTALMSRAFTVKPVPDVEDDLLKCITGKLLAPPLVYIAVLVPVDVAL
jgi:hypothetical protein